MKKVLIALSLFVALLAQASMAKAAELWTSTGASYKFADRHSISLESENRFGGLASLPGHYLYNTTLGYKFDWVKWDSGSFAIAPAIRYEKEDGNDGEYRPMVNLELKQKFGGGTIGVRNRVEVRLRGSQKRIRERLRLKYNLFSFKVGDRVKISPYVSNEIFYQKALTDGSGGRGFDQNRVVPAGVSIDHSFEDSYLKKMSWDLYYMVDMDKGGSGWTANHVAGVGLKFSLGPR
ncbi:MAG: DUF2490 domain-containing protein [Deltaproteobacteria bacterium]|nr:DUF2490 domain-containing protein [Deltaproteobacteria bacterium]